jgi:hypothetical protein
LDEKEMRKKFAGYSMIVVAFLYWILLFTASVTQADLYVYDLQANLSENNVTYVDQEPFYYDIFHIQTDSYSTLAFDNYDAE